MADDAPETFCRSDLVKEFAALYALHQDKIGPAATDGKSISFGVGRQSFWNQWRPKLRESLAHLVGLIMRRAGGDASGALRASFV